MKLHILAEQETDAEGNPVGPKREAGLRVENLPNRGRQRIPSSIISQFSRYITKGPEQIVFHTVDGDLAFRIIHPPGRHCLTCGERLAPAGKTPQEEAQNAAAARAHVLTHDNPVVTDRWPHGYCHFANSYDCEVL